jgi:hypothetical protein
MKELTIARGVLVCMATAFLAMGSAEAQETDATATSDEVTTPTEEVPTTDSTTETGADSVPTGKIAAEFQDFLGADAESVVRGLRNGESFTLTETTPGETTPGETPDQPGSTTEVTIDPATGKMGYGNVRTSLQLSQFQLQQAGIDQPTASQLDAALNGGSVTNSEGTTTELQGVLALRSEGMGWGRIAQEYGTKVGWVKNGRASLTAPTSEGTGGEAGDAGGEGLAPSGDTTSGEGVEVVGRSSEAGDGIVDAAGNVETNRANGNGRGASKKSGASAVVTGTGAPSGPGRSQGVVTGLGKSSNGRGRGQGIVNGVGGSSNGRGGSRVTTGLGSSSGSNGRGAGYGIVNGVGGSSSGRGGSRVTTGLGNSSGSNGRGGGSHGNRGGNGRGHGRGK